MMDNLTLKAKLTEVYNTLGALIGGIEVEIPQTQPQMGASIFDLQFTTGWLDRLKAVGGWVKQGKGSYKINVKDGKAACELIISTTTGAAAAYMFVWRQALMTKDAYFFSCKYFIPSVIAPGEWHHIAQWKSTNDGNTDNSIRTVALGIEEAGDTKYLYLSHRKNLAGDKQSLSSRVPVPVDRWFELATYYKRAMDNTGRVTVWQDGRQIFDLDNIVTVFGDNTLQWSPCSYSETALPRPCSIWIADMAINEVA